MKFSVKMDSYFLALIPVLLWMPCVIGLLANPHLSYKITTIVVWSILFCSMSLCFLIKAQGEFNLIEDFSKKNLVVPLFFLNKVIPADERNVWAYYSFDEEILAIKIPKDADWHNYRLRSSDVVSQFNHYTMFFPGKV